MTVVDNVRPVGDLERLADVVVRHQYADSPLLEVEDDPLNIRHSDRIDAGERFVEQNERGRHHQCPGDLYPSALSSGKRVRPGIRERREMQFGEQVVGAASAFGPRQLERFEDREDVLPDGQAAEHGRLLREIPNTPLRTDVHRVAGDVLVVKQHSSRVGRSQANDHVEGSCLARTVRAEQADHLARMDLKADAADDGAPAVRLGEVRSLEGSHGRTDVRSKFLTGTGGGCRTGLRPSVHGDRVAGDVERDGAAGCLTTSAT